MVIGLPVTLGFAGVPRREAANAFILVAKSCGKTPPLAAAREEDAGGMGRRAALIACSGLVAGLRFEGEAGSAAGRRSGRRGGGAVADIDSVAASPELAVRVGGFGGGDGASVEAMAWLGVLRSMSTLSHRQ